MRPRQPTLSILQESPAQLALTLQLIPLPAAHAEKRERAKEKRRQCTSQDHGQDAGCSISLRPRLLWGALGASLAVVVLNCALWEAVDFVSLNGMLCVGFSGLNLLRRVTENQPAPWNGWLGSLISTWDAMR